MRAETATATFKPGTWHHNHMSASSTAGVRIDHAVFRASAIGALLIVVVGLTATWRAAVREVTGHTEDAPIQLTVLGLEMTQMALFAAFASFGAVRPLTTNE